MVADLLRAGQPTAGGVAAALQALREEAGLPKELLAAGSTDQALEVVVALALQDPAIQGSPREPEAGWLTSVLAGPRGG